MRPSKVWRQKNAAYRRWELSMLSRIEVQVKAIGFRRDPIMASFDGLTNTVVGHHPTILHLETLRWNAELSVSAAWAEEGPKWIVLNARPYAMSGSWGVEFDLNHGVAYDIEVSFGDEAGYAHGEIRLHFDPIPLQRVKVSAPKGWAAVRWWVQGPVPIHRSTLAREVQRGTESWD